MKNVQDPAFLKTEIYAVPHEGKTIAYAPLTRFFSIHEGIVAPSELPSDWIAEASDPENVPEFILEKGFADERKKMKVRMNVTSKCNLSCSYCSVSAKTGMGQHMDRELAFTAISQMVDLAEKQGMTEIELAFSGWEPTLQSGLVEEIVEFADERLESGNIRLVTKLLTNGVLSESVAKRLVPLFNGVQISWDGFLENHPRYGSENAKVAKAVWKSIKTFSEASSTVNIAIVASEHNAHLLGKIIDEIYDSFQIEHIFIALKDTLGKASGEKGLDYGALRKEYVRAWKKYRAIGIDIPLTGTDVHSISQYPCGLSAPNLSIAPDGSISSCTVSFNDSDAFAKRFDIGRVSPIGLVLDGKRIEAFQSLDVASLPECSDCFSKWHCRGGCTYANRNAPMPEIAPERCDFIRKVVADKILHLAWVG